MCYMAHTPLHKRMRASGPRLQRARCLRAETPCDPTQAERDPGCVRMVAGQQARALRMP